MNEINNTSPYKLYTPLFFQGSNLISDFLSSETRNLANGPSLEGDKIFEVIGLSSPQKSKENFSCKNKNENENKNLDIKEDEKEEGVVSESFVLKEPGFNNFFDDENEKKEFKKDDNSSSVLGVESPYISLNPIIKLKDLEEDVKDGELPRNPFYNEANEVSTVVHSQLLKTSLNHNTISGVMNPEMQADNLENENSVLSQVDVKKDLTYSASIKNSQQNLLNETPVNPNENFIIEDSDKVEPLPKSTTNKESNKVAASVLEVSVIEDTSSNTNFDFDSSGSGKNSNFSSEAEAGIASKQGSFSLKTSDNSSPIITSSKSILNTTKGSPKSDLPANTNNKTAAFDLPPLLMKQLELIQQGVKNWATVELELSNAEKVQVHLQMRANSIQTTFTSDVDNISYILGEDWSHLASEAALKGIRLEQPKYVYKPGKKGEESNESFYQNADKKSPDDKNS